jgi:hypothetical protein
MDISVSLYETLAVVHTGPLRARLASTLSAAYADGLLSEGTFNYRLEVLFSSRVIDPARLIGDLTLRAPTRRWSAVAEALVRRVTVTFAGARDREPPIVLGLDWDGAHDELLVGRHPECDVVVSDPTVSRRHARLSFRDGRWILRDLESTNGTVVNRARVGRCELRPGDRVLIGDQELLID